MKKSKGLESRLIELTKFDIQSIEGRHEQDELREIITKLFKTTRKAKGIYNKEIQNPAENMKTPPEEFWREVIQEAEKLGIGLIGFAPIEEDFMFIHDHINGIETLYDNGIILGMEMDYDAIDTAPEPPAGLEALRIYAELGEATNNLTQFIQSKGYNAIACHPLGGPILYPAMAVKANLGKIGRQGLLITKKYGPRQRLSMISINAGPLPKNFNKEIDIEDYCTKCGRCIQTCPVEAIYKEPKINEDGTITRIDGATCIEYFYETYGCSVCIKECPFHKIGYQAMFYSRL